MASGEPTTRVRDEAAQRGSLGPATFELMTRVVGYELTRFPALNGSDSVESFVNGFFEAKGSGYVNAVFAMPDDAAAARLTHKWVQNWLVDCSRQLPWGALRNRLEKRLERSGLFKRSAVAHYWLPADGSDNEDDRTATETELFAIARSSHVEIRKSSDTGAVKLGQTGELEAMLERLLIAAGRLHISDLTRICADRFPSLMQSGDVLHSTVDTDWSLIEETETAHDVIEAARTKGDDEQLAEHIYSLLTEVECTTIRFGDDPISLAQELGIGRSSAYSVIKKLRARLIELTGDIERSAQVRAALIGLVLDEFPGVPSTENMENSSAI